MTFYMETQVTTLPVLSLEVCDRVRVRNQKPKINSDVVQEYTEAYQLGKIDEPLDVFQEQGTERYIVADGENRLLALRRAKIENCDCRLHQGDEIAALDFALGCNQAHGLRRTKADKAHAFARIMETPLRKKYKTDTALSAKLGVSIATIARYKADWRVSKGGNRQAKREAQERAEQHTQSEPINDRLPSKTPKESKTSREKVKLTPEQARVAADTREAIRRDQVSASNKKELIQGLHSVRMVAGTLDGDGAARRWPEIDAAHVRFLRDWCDEFLTARDKVAA